MSLIWEAHNVIDRWREWSEHQHLSHDEFFTLVSDSDELQDRLLDAELAMHGERLAEAERLLREWVADAYCDPRANLPDLVNRTRHAIGAVRSTDSAPAVCPKCSGTGKEPVNGGTGWYRCPCGAADSAPARLTPNFDPDTGTATLVPIADSAPAATELLPLHCVHGKRVYERCEQCETSATGFTRAASTAAVRRANRGRC